MHPRPPGPTRSAFAADDPRRGRSDQLDLGATWRWAGSNDAWRLGWVRDTGELYLCRADGHDGSCTDVSVLAVVPGEADVDALLEGWRDRRTDPDGLSWVLRRTALLAACAERSAVAGALPTLARVSTLADLVRARTGLGAADLGWLHRLVGEWQLVADLSFADLLLHVRTTDGTWLAVAHMRPTTGPTTYPQDVVGVEVPRRRRGRFERVARRVPIGGSDPDWRARVPVRQEVVPVRRGARVIAVLSRETNLNAARMPSALELTYLTTAGELLQMVGEGRFPFPGSTTDREHAPRVGDGLVRLDRTGHVVYASPNALSAFRRLGVSGDLLGAHLGHTIARLSAAARACSTSRAARRPSPPCCASPSRASPRSRRRARPSCCGRCRCTPAASRAARWCWSATSPSCGTATGRSSARTRRSARSTTG